MIFIFISVMVPLLLLSYNLTIRQNNKSGKFYTNVWKGHGKVEKNKTNLYFNLCFIYEKNCKLSYNESPNELDLHIVLCIKYIILLDARSNHIRTI